MSLVDDSDAARLVARAQDSLNGRDAHTALALLAEAEALGPSVDIHLARALSFRVLGDLNKSLASLESALALEPKNFLALLSKGATLERMGAPKVAAVAYKQAVAVAPPQGEIPPSLAAPMARAREAVAAHAEALAEHLRASVSELRGQFGGDALDRFDEGLEIFAGRARAYVQEPLLLNYPRLPAIPFLERRHFPWLAELEAATPMIQGELEVAMQVKAEDFAPYIAFPPGVPVNQWRELNHSRRWSSLFLWRDGARQDAVCELCPGTAALLENLPMAGQPGFAPTAMFSALEAHTRIPAHVGSTNTRLIVHLPLILPGPARFRVGNVVRQWRLGEAWVFDDTIEHEAWNDADQVRVILIFDVWNPHLTEAERALISAMMTAKNKFQALP